MTAVVPSSSPVRPSLWIVFAALAVAYGLLAPCPGTPDVAGFWVPWTNQMREHGFAAGYQLSGTDYPPGSWAVLLGLSRLADLTGISGFAMLKIAISALAFAGALVLYRWTRNLWWSAGLLAALAINAAAHGYLDVLYLPPLLLALHALQRRRLAWAGFLFALAMSMKWQPLLIAPFFALWVARPGKDEGWVPARLARNLAWCALGALPVLLAELAAGPHALRHAFGRSIMGGYLSCQALNFGWIVQWVVYHAKGLVALPYYEMIPSRALALPLKGGFFAIYGALLFACGRRAVSFPDFVRFAAAGVLAYFAFNINVHENHLFIAVVLAFVLGGLGEARAWIPALFLSVLFNLNLILFYGLGGMNPPWPVPPWWVTLPVSLVTVLAGIRTVARLIRGRAAY